VIIMLKQYINLWRAFLNMVIYEGAEFWRNRNEFSDVTISKRYTFLAGFFWGGVFYTIIMFVIASVI